MDGKEYTQGQRIYHNGRLQYLLKGHRKTVEANRKHPKSSREGSKKKKFPTEYIATGFKTDMTITIRDKISDHYIMNECGSPTNPGVGF